MAWTFAAKCGKHKKREVHCMKIKIHEDRIYYADFDQKWNFWKNGQNRFPILSIGYIIYPKINIFPCRGVPKPSVNKFWTELKDTNDSVGREGSWPIGLYRIRRLFFALVKDV